MKETFFDRNPGLWSQFLTSFVASAYVISDGMHFGWTAPTLPLLEGSDSPIPLTNEDHIWLESIFLIGSLCGIPLTISIVDKFGRKKTIMLSAFLQLIAWILIAVANNVIYIYIGRFLVGVAGDASYVAIPMYIAEIAEKDLRGLCAGVNYVLFLVGILVIYAVAPHVPLYVPSIIGGVIICAQIITFIFMPDSPYYLVAKDKPEEAKKNLKRLRGTENVDEEMAEIVAAIKRQKSEKGRPQDLLLDKGNRKGVIILFVLNAAEHLSSVTVLFMNLQNIFTQADSTYLSAYASSIIFSGLMLVASIGADAFVDKCGRKILLIVSSLLSGFCLLALAIYFTLQKQEVDVKPISWIPVVSVMLYAFCFKLGLGIIPIVITGELFPARVRAIGMASGDLFYCFFGWLSIELFQRLSASVGYDAPFYIFSVCCFLSVIFIKFYIPETKGKSLDEIQFILKGEPFPTTNDGSPKKDQTIL